MGKLIDLREELRMRMLARHLVEGLCLPEEAIEEYGGAVEFAKVLMAQVDSLPEGNSESILDDHPELFNILRKRATG